MHDVLIKGGTVIDPYRGINEIRDVAISGGLIAGTGKDIPATEAQEVIDASGKVVAPGLIDLHAHVAERITELGANPDRAGVERGVTAVCDGGSVGCSNFPAFLTQVVQKARTDVLCFIHVCPTGLTTMPEIKSWDDINVQETIDVARDQRAIVKGMKVRAITPLAQVLGCRGIEKAKEIAWTLEMPLMVHIGDGLAGEAAPIMEEFTREAIQFLDRGDIITHIYTGAPGALIKPDGWVAPELEDAVRRGVVLDPAHGRPNLSFAVAKAGIARGIIPTTISTDLASTNIDGPIYSLVLTMSKFLALGLSMEQVVRMTTINPALVIGEANIRGSLGYNMPADISILDIRQGDFTFKDGLIGNTIQGGRLILPWLTFKDGKAIKPRPGAEKEIG